MKSSTKTVKPSTPRQKKTNEVIRSEGEFKYLDQYLDLRVMKHRPVSAAFLERLGTEFVEFALEGKNEAKENEEKATFNQRKIRVLDFFAYRGISGQTIKRWKVLSPTFAAQYAFGKALIGGRRERGAFFKVGSEKIFLQNAHQYEEDWKEAVEYHAKLAKEEQSAEEILWKLDSYKTEDDRKETTVPCLETPSPTP